MFRVHGATDNRTADFVDRVAPTGPAMQPGPAPEGAVATGDVGQSGALPVARSLTSSNSVVNGTTLPLSSSLKTTLRLNSRL